MNYKISLRDLLKTPKSTHKLKERSRVRLKKVRKYLQAIYGILQSYVWKLTKNEKFEGKERCNEGKAYHMRIPSFRKEFLGKKFCKMAKLLSLSLLEKESVKVTHAD